MAHGQMTKGDSPRQSGPSLLGHEKKGRPPLAPVAPSPLPRHENRDIFRGIWSVRHNAGWHVTTRVVWLASVGGFAFSPQPLLHTTPSVSRAWVGGLKLAMVQGQHRGGFSVMSMFSALTLFLAFAVRLAALAGPEADLAVWIFLRVVKTR